MSSPSPAPIVFRPVTPDDDPHIAAIIRQVMPEYGANGPGFAILDPEVDGMSAAYPGGRARYLVAVERDRVVGGGGFAPLTGADADTCELRKMYFLPELRGRGVGSALLGRLLGDAKKAGFTRCYLETLTSMTEAQKLYVRFGFAPLPAPLGATGHYGCDRWFARPL